MLFTKKAVGLDICQDELRFVLLGGKRDHPRLDSWVTRPFSPDIIRLSTKEPNVLNPSAFVAAIREAHLLLLAGTGRVSVSLPDAIGRVLLLDLETGFKSREEGRDIIRWKLKKSLPLDVNEIHLDYQVLQEKETGEISTLVALLSRQVLTQYEELLVEAGLEPNRIDFASFNRYRLYSERIELPDYSAYVTYFGRSVGIFIFNGGILEFFRSKDIAGSAMDADRIFRELNSSFMVYREKHPGHALGQVFLSASHDELELFQSVVAEATRLEPVTLEVDKVLSRKDGFTAEKKTLSLLTAALGAATRNL